MGITAGLFAIILIAYMVLRKTLNKSDMKRIKQLREGTEKKYTSDILYQKLYINFMKIPFLKRYVTKLRRKLEIVNVDDEYLTRKQTARIISKAMLIVIPLTILIIIFLKGNALLLSIALLFEAFLIETIMSGMVDKLDTKLLKQQISFFAEIRHAYHEYNMVEEAIYEVSQNDQLEVSRQGEKIYEILTSDNPEIELEKYYDIAPNSYLKEFAGISYLTREFGDRKDTNGASLYLKNLNNITEEMQLEILKREKLDYVFQSLSLISILPILCIEPVKKWSISNFSFTSSFYNGKLGFVIQLLLVLVTFVCYILTRKLKDNGGIRAEYQDPNSTWQVKLYNKPIIKKIVNLFLPKEGTKQYNLDTNLLKDAASKQKMETFYVNRLVLFVIVFIASLFLFTQIHNVAVGYIYENAGSEYDLLGSMSKKEEEVAMSRLEADNYFLNKLKGKKLTLDQIKSEIKFSEYYKGATDKEIDEGASRLEGKLKVVNKEYLQWFEWLLAFVFSFARIFCTKMDVNIPKINEEIRNRKRSNAVPNNNINAYENRKSKCRNDIRVARKIF